MALILWTAAASWLPATRLHAGITGRTSRSSTARPIASASATATFLETVFDTLDYEAILLSDSGEEDDDVDDTAVEYTYGESDLGFFLSVLATALATADTSARLPKVSGFCDLGGGKGQLALAAAHAEPERLSGPCVSLEIIPELHAIAASAVSRAAELDAAYARVSAVRGDLFRGDSLAQSVEGAAVCFCYASLFASESGTHAEQLSAALAAASLPPGAVVATINRQLCEADGWRVAAPSIEGPTPQEDAQTGVVYFYCRG